MTTGAESVQCGFDDASLLDALEAIPLDRIDEIGFGLIVMNRSGEVTGYNAAESKLSGLAVERVPPPGAVADAGPGRVAEAVSSGPKPMSEDALPAWRDDAQELQDLRQFFYQCPVGLFEIDDDGLVLKVNPAAVAMLAPAIGRSNLAKLFPILDRLAPDLIGVISQDRDRMGPLAAGERILGPRRNPRRIVAGDPGRAGRRGAGHGGTRRCVGGAAPGGGAGPALRGGKGGSC